jgi:hypothetical protein
MNRRIAVTIALLVLMALWLGACAPGPNPLEDVAREGGGVAGFWLGLWHGIIAPITFIISIFRPDVRIYEVHNNGLWYNLGFVLGAGILLGGSSSASRR